MDQWKLPKNWQWTTLVSVGKIFAGSSAPQSDEYFIGGKYPFVRVSDLGKEKRTANFTITRDYLNDKAVAELKLVSAKPGTILFPKSGAAILTNNRALLRRNAYIVSHLAAIEPDESRWLSEWVYYWLCLVDMKHFLQNIAYPSLKLSTIKQIPIPVPYPNDPARSLAEQRRIVARIEALLGEVRAARALHEEIVRDTGRLMDAVLAEVFEKIDSLAGHDKSIEQITDVTSGGTPLRSKKEYYQGDIPWVKTGELKDNTIFDTEEHITQEAIENSNAKLFPVGTLLVAMYGQGQTRGRTGILGVEAATNQACCAILPNKDIFDSYYLQFWFRFMYSTLRQESESRGGNQPNLNQRIIRRLKPPLPDIATQRKIVSQLRSIEFEITEMRKNQAKEAKLLDDMEQAILTQAFRGEL